MNIVKMKDIRKDNIYEEFLQYRESLEDYANSLLGSREDARDMVQDLYMKLWSRKDTLFQIENPKAYCYSVIKRQCLDVLKSAERKNAGEMPLDMESTQTGVEEQLALKEQLAYTLKEVDNLPEGQKNVLLKNAVDGYSYEQITAQTGQSAQTVRTQMSLARKKLRTRTAWIFAAAVLVAGIFLWAANAGRKPKELVDTYSDPYMAYAQIEKSFRKIGDCVENGSQKARESEQRFQSIRKVFEK